DELSDSDESETDKRALAEDAFNYLHAYDEPDFSYLGPEQSAALGGLFSIGLISDPLRTSHNSTQTEVDFFDVLGRRAEGDISFHEGFGDKEESEFLPARSEGSSEQRESLRDRQEELRGEIQADLRLWENNCLINAISRAAHGQNATEEELLHIRFNLDNVGQMLLADPRTIGVIRNALQINNTVVVHYPSPTPAETIHGILPVLDVYHTGAYHFVHNRPNGVLYS
ncbi:MAG: hypothetical protein ACRD3S_09895, partial [Terracidiphilus sp.]